MTFELQHPSPCQSSKQQASGLRLRLVVPKYMPRPGSALVILCIGMWPSQI